MTDARDKQASHPQTKFFNGQKHVKIKTTKITEM